MAACNLRPAGESRVPVQEEVVKIKSAHEGGREGQCLEIQVPPQKAGPHLEILARRQAC